MCEADGMDERKREYWNRRFQRHWGLKGAGTTHFGLQFNAWRYRVRRRVFRRAVGRLNVDPGAISVLEVGSGTGFYVEQWEALGARAISALDISDWAANRLAQDHPGVTFYHADIGAPAVPLPPGAFDVVTAVDCLTHIVEDAAWLRALKNIHRALKPGGCLLYSDSFFHGPDKCFRDYWRGRSLAKVAAAMDETGFDIVARAPFLVLMSAPTDTRHRDRNERLWEMAFLPFLHREWTGFLLGACLYPLELALVSLLDESPAIELMTCRKRSPGA
jgi:SAM-dependent methyltransferase